MYCFHPIRLKICVLFCLSQDISAETALEAFHKWICSACSTEAPLVLCSGMLLTCDVPEGRLFYFTLLMIM